MKLGQERRLKESRSNHMWLRSHFTVNNGKHAAHLRFTPRVGALCAEAGLRQACWDTMRVSFWSDSHIKEHQRLIFLLNLLEVGGSCGRIKRFLSVSSPDTHTRHMLAPEGLRQHQLAQFKWLTNSFAHGCEYENKHR